MKIVITVSFFVLFLAICVLSQDYIYVLNGLAETISVINIETGEVENHVVTVGAIPNQVVYHEGLLYVVNSGSASLQVIEPVNFDVVADVPLEINSWPWNVAFISGFAFVTGFATASVYKIDLASMSVVNTFSVGQAPEGIIAFDGKLFIANTGFNPDDYTFGQGTVTVLDPYNGSSLADVNVGKNPQALVAGPDELINVVCTGDYSSTRGTIYFLETESYSVVDSLAMGGDPYWPVINSLGICFVSAGGWFADGYVFSYDAVARIVLRDEDNPIMVGTGAMGLAIDSLGMLYSTGQIDNSVTEFNDQGEVQATYPVGGGPMSLTISDSRTFVQDAGIVPGNVILGKPYPNPFNVSVILPLAGNVDESMGVTVEIFDSNGRFVCTLNPDKKYSINRHIRWDGSSFAGSGVSSGVYFARLRGTSEVVKMVLLR